LYLEVSPFCTRSQGLLFKSHSLPHRVKSPTHFSILTICQTSTAFLLINMIKAGRSCAVWSFAVIDEVKNDSDASTDVNDSIEDVNDFLFTASAAAAVNSLDLSSAEIADREIKMWKTRTVPFPKDKNPLDEWRHGAVHLFPWLCVLVRCVLAIPATSAAPKSLFSTAGNVMTKKRSRLTCDNMEELVYLHRCGRSCGSGRWSRRCAWSDFFWNQ